MTISPGIGRQARTLFRQSQEALGQNQILTALRFAEEVAAIEPTMRGVAALRAECLAGLGRLPEALDAVNAELKVQPGNRAIVDLRKSISAAIQHQESLALEDRQWASSIRNDFIPPIEEGSHRYAYRGHPMIKNPFDMALYPMLLWNLKPATIFEIGSFSGASALWMADTLQSYEIKSHIWSVDIVPVTTIQHPDVTFLAGSGRDLETLFPARFLAECPRPFLVIEDADHTYETSRAVLEHFHPHLQPGEYIVIEDGLTSDGPRKALAEFLPAHAEQYQVDATYCDFFGYNATWCVNGFLRRTA